MPGIAEVTLSEIFIGNSMVDSARTLLVSHAVVPQVNVAMSLLYAAVVST